MICEPTWTWTPSTVTRGRRARELELSHRARLGPGAGSAQALEDGGQGVGLDREGDEQGLEPGEGGARAARPGRDRVEVVEIEGVRAGLQAPERRGGAVER